MLQLFAALVFLAVVFASVGFVLRKRDEGVRVLRSRLATLVPGPASAGVQVERDTRYSTLPPLDALLRSLDLSRHLELLLYQAGMSTRVGVLVLATAALGMGGYLFGVVFFHRLWPGLLFLALCLPIPYLFVLYKKSARMRAFADEFPDALDLLVSALRAGLSFTAAMQIVAEESPEPLRSEFAVTVEEQALGLDFKESMVNLCRRVDSLDLRFFATAVMLQRETGGNLAEILENTAKLIRDRFRILGDIKTITAQGRLTGAILVCLPLAVGLFTLLVAPDYLRPMLDSEKGRGALVVAAAMQVLGILVIRKIIAIKV
jgi:tight adherence protein B